MRRKEEALKLIYATQEKERNRIAINLHDNLGAMLATIKYYITKLSESTDTSTTQSLHNSAIHHVDKALLDLHTTVHDLIPKNISNNGWLGELKELLVTIHKTSNLLTNIEVEGEIPRYGEAAELNLFRIVQELLTNSIKHAKATKLSFLIHQHKSSLSIYYNDDGIGMNPVENKNGFGLMSLKARTTLYHGFFDIKSENGKGSFFKIIFEEKYLLKQE